MLFKQKVYFKKNSIDFGFYFGQVLKIFYIAKHKKKKRSYSFIGLCIFKSLSKFLLINSIKHEKILFTFPLFGPSILRIFIIYLYKVFSYRVNKMYFRKRLFFKDDYKIHLNKIFSSIKSFDYDFMEFFVSEL